MNTTTRTATALGVSALAAFGLAFGGTAASAVAPESIGPVSVSASADVDDVLTYMREEERLARDLYAAIADYYGGARPFSMITRSEERHFDAVGRLLETYDIADPSAGLAAGTYADDDLQALYDDLLSKAQTSLAAAYEVGITIEETDIADLDAALAADYPSDVDRVLENLKDGSQRHLAAYTAAAEGTIRSGDGHEPGAGSGGERSGEMGHPGGRDGSGIGHDGGRPGSGDRDCQYPGS
ncbi:DUF2202 domain-containing protein [Microbacterium schleiferi]|uniref:DUF2202 domain-containing protein n=1 Tax=Microbacterium schleiferi TaxID=69362 RepID=A0A7S8MXP1_9MICO|nr:DUF2202 domain-containing protein [Microbacterium schleiferi]QPE04838.1 DUF2202 domain-containing protein [Microbacterium schleiferi]